MMACVIAGGLFTACNDNSFEVGETDEGRYAVSNELKGFITDVQGKRLFTNVEFKTSGETQLFLNTTKAQSTTSTVTVTYDVSALNEYNQKNGLNYEAFPQNLVSLAAEGQITLAAGERKSSGLTVSYTSDGSLTPNKSYVIPLRITNTGDIKFNESDATRLIFVKDLTSLANARKSNGVYILSCMEINRTNPLNNLCFTLANTPGGVDDGKYLIDGVVMFSSNVMYDQERRRMYLSHNENNQALLDGYEKYLKPLQDAGMHVYLSLLGNGGSPGMGNFTAETSKAFAQEIKNICDAYNLDGVFFDDEYSNTSGFVNTPGFTTNAQVNASRLAYEVKKAQPHRLVSIFRWDMFSSMHAITEDGVTYQPGSYVDYVYPNYGTATLTSGFTGVPLANIGVRNQEYAGGNSNGWPTEANMRAAKDAGYLTNMIFALDPFWVNFAEPNPEATGNHRGQFQLQSLQRTARAYFDGDIVYDGKPFPKDW